MKERRSNKIQQLSQKEEEQIKEQFSKNIKQLNNPINIVQKSEENKTNTSSSDTKEQFDWINPEKNREMVENYSLFHLNFWKTITYDKLEKDRPIRLGTCYQDCVNDVLENDVFKGEDFKRETMKYGVIKDRGISPDFYVQNIDTEKFKNIIKERQYMFKMKYTIPSQIKKINVIGEAKISKSRSRKEHQKG